MDVTQIYTFVNTAAKEALGSEAISAEDTSTLVDLGTQLFNANAFDKYVKSLVNHIGKVIFVSRLYRGRAPKVLMDAFEFGSVVEKIRMTMPDAVEDPSWNLVDGESYDTHIFYQPTVSAKFFNSKTAYMIPISIAERQVRQSFSNATQMGSFISMIETAISNAITVRFDELIMRVINNFSAEVWSDEGGTSSVYPNGAKAVNLLASYNTLTGSALTVAQCFYDTEFLKYAGMVIRNYVKYLQDKSVLYNVGKTDRFTPSDLLHVVMLSDFASATATYLQADTYHRELVELPKYEEVSHWQAVGTDGGSRGAINITDKMVLDGSTGKLLCVMFDHEALGVYNNDPRTTSAYNAIGEFTNYYYKQEASYFNDLNENFVLFYVHA